MSPEVCKNPVVNTTELDFRPELLSRQFKQLIDAGYGESVARGIIRGVAEI